MACTVPTTCDFSDCSNTLRGLIFSFQQVVANTSGSINYNGACPPDPIPDSVCPNKQGSNTDTVMYVSPQGWSCGACGCTCKTGCTISDHQCGGLNLAAWCSNSDIVNPVNFQCMTVDTSLYTSSNLPSPKSFSRYAENVGDNTGKNYNVYQFYMDFTSITITENTMSDFYKLFITNIPSYFVTTAVSNKNIYQCNINFYNCLLNTFCCTTGTASNIASTICKNSVISTTCLLNSTFSCPNLLNYCNSPTTFQTAQCIQYYENSYNPTTLSMNTDVQNVLYKQCAAYVDTNNNISSSYPATPCACFLPYSAYQNFWNEVLAGTEVDTIALNNPDCAFPDCVNSTLPNYENKYCPEVTLVNCIANVNVGSVSEDSSVSLMQNCIAQSNSTSGTVGSDGTANSSSSASTNAQSNLNVGKVTTSSPDTSSRSVEVVLVIIVLLVVGILGYYFFFRPKPNPKPKLPPSFMNVRPLPVGNRYPPTNFAPSPMKMNPYSYPPKR